jgi:hypothetical protein
MSRKVFLTLTGIIAMTIGVVVLTIPGPFIANVKMAAPSATANVMARTVGVLLLAVGTLNLLVRGHGDSPTMRSVLLFNLVLQLAILPIDPVAFFSGVYGTVGSFVPNTILHLVLASGFARYLITASTRARTAHLALRAESSIVSDHALSAGSSRAPLRRRA